MQLSMQVDAAGRVLGPAAPLYTTPADITGAALNTFRPAPRGHAFIPFRPDGFADQSVGSASAVFYAADERTSAPVDGNEDGSHSVLYCSLSASATWANYVFIRVGFYGRLFGLRWRHQSTGDTTDWWQKPFSVSVDGVYRAPDLTPIYEAPYYVRTFAQRSRANILFNDLAPGWHLAGIHIPCDTAATRTLIFDGMIVEDGAGNPQGPIAEIIAPMAPVAVGTGSTWTKVDPRTSSQGTPRLFGLKAVYIRNTNAAGGLPVTVSARLSFASGAGTYAAFWSGTIAPQQTEILRLSDGGNGGATVQALELNADVSGAQFVIQGVR